jgi:hypothetical protein
MSHRYRKNIIRCEEKTTYHISTRVFIMARSHQNHGCTEEEPPGDDPSLSSFLERLREGKLNTSDIIQLQERVVGHPLGPDLIDPVWQEVKLITPRNMVRQSWNN